MSAAKVCRKKLCDAGTAACIFSFVALLASAAGCALEFAGSEIYRMEFGDYNSKLFVDKCEEYFAAYENSVTSFVLAAAVFIICVINRKRKKIGAEMGALVTLVSAAAAIAPALYVYNYLEQDSTFRKMIEENGTNEMQFMYVMQILMYALPLLACVFLFLCGITLWGRNATDSFLVNCPVMKMQPVHMPEDYMEVKVQSKPEETAPSFEFTNSNYTAPEPSAIQSAQDISVPPEQSAETVIPDTPRCLKCGAVLKNGAKFCQRCGTKIE